VLLNLGDGSGGFGHYLTPQPVGVEASPNEPADFDNDGHADLCLAASSSNSVWVLLGSGDGTFGSITEYPVGNEPHGIVPLDVDGDGDRDIVNANFGSNNLSLLINDGTGHFAPAVFFSGGVNGEYGLAGGDMDGDGLVDLVVAGNTSQTIRVLTANGNGGFTSSDPAQNTGGQTWGVTLGDLDNDGDLDATISNSFSGNGAVLKGNGDGTFAAPVITTVGAHTPSTDLADLDGDGDLDWVLSSYGGGFWRIYTNNGSGAFTFQQQINAPSNPSCAVLFDLDNDGDVDLGLTDEIADVVVLMKNATAWKTAGHALGGVHGDPFCTGAGSLVGGTPVTIRLSNARENATAWFLAGVSAIDAPFKGGVLVPDPAVVVALNSGPSGALTVPGTWPTGIPSGVGVHIQWWIADAAGPAGFAASNAITGTTP
jgi:FG-GAP-like repeat